MSFTFDSYNSQQRRVVEHTAGPLLVISGAGTGKTRVLTGRVLNLIFNHGVEPESILTLTFTEKAQREMLERIDSGLPLGHPEVTVKTFHAFCDSILKEKGLEIGLDTEYQLLDEVNLLVFLKRHYPKLKFKYFASRSNPQRILQSFLGYVSRLYDEDVSPADYTAHAQMLVKNAVTDEEKEEAVKHSELSYAYQIYTELLVEEGCIDYGGLLFHTLRLLEERPSIRAALQKRFTHIMVDEFQDTNFAQNKIVTLLASTHRNLMVVGDDDQAIYKWRGASLSNMQFFKKNFPETQTVALTENYRSSQPILDLAHAVIQGNNPSRLEVTESVDKRLVAKSVSTGEMPEVHHFYDVNEEVIFVVKRAMKELKAGKKVAVLVRTNALAEPFIESFKKHHCDVEHGSLRGFLDKPAIKDARALIRVMVNPWDDVALFKFLSLPLWKLPMEALLECLKKSRGDTTKSLFSELKGEQCEKYKNLILELIEYSRTNPVSQVLGRFYTLSGYVERAQEVEESEVLEDLALFSEKVREFEETHGDSSVRAFDDYLTLMESVGGVPVGGRDFATRPAVSVLTIHASKGLEFDTVFLPCLAHNKFPTINRRESFEVPDELLEEELPAGNHHLAEERRLFYVGVTRARTKLYLSYATLYDGPRVWKPSTFILESQATHQVKDFESPSVKKNNGKHGEQIALDLGMQQSRKGSLTLSLPRLSYSQIDTFRTCPLKYQFRYLFNLPSSPAPALSFGTTLHNTLRDFYVELKENASLSELDMSERLEQLYKKNWMSVGYTDRHQHDEYFLHGAELLASYYQKNRSLSYLPSYIEEAFTLNIGRLTITGRIDRIDKLEDGTYEIIDYKTTENPDTKNLENDLQLSIYALAAAQDLKITVSKLSLYFLETGEKASTIRTPEQLESCKKELELIAQEIATSDFSPNPAYHCSYCDYRLICPAAGRTR